MRRTCDHHMGRVIDAVKQLPDADNTHLHLHRGDNGSSAEGGLEGSLNENLFFNGFPEKWQDNLKAIDELGGPKHFNHFPSAWAHAMNTPFQWTKQVASHFGGTRNPMIISWPARIKDKGGLRRSSCTSSTSCRRSTRRSASPRRRMLNGIEQKPIEGISFADDVRRCEGPGAAHTTQYFELLVNRGLYHDGWMASCAFVCAVATGAQRVSIPISRSGSSTTSTRISRRPTTSRPRIREKLRRAAGPLVGGGARVQRAAARLARRRAA